MTEPGYRHSGGIAAYENAQIAFELATPANKQSTLLQLVSGLGGGRAVVFCMSGEICKALCSALQGAGFAAASFLKDEHTGQNPEDLQVALTNIENAQSYGSGVGLCVHYDIPANLGAYLAQVQSCNIAAGRAVLFYSARDVVVRQRAIATLPQDVQDTAKAELSSVVTYCHAERCLRTQLAEYASGQAVGYCGNCSVCKNNYEEKDITDISRIIFSCVFKMGHACTYKTVVAVLRGSKSTKLRAQRLHLLATYGMLSDMEEDTLQEVLAHLVKAGYLSLDRGCGAVLALTAKAQDALHTEENITMRLRKRATRKTGVTHTLSGDDAAMVQALKALREKLAAQAGLPVYSVFTDGALRDMVTHKPANRSQLQALHSVSETSLRRFGDAMLEKIAEFTKKSI